MKKVMSSFLGFIFTSLCLADPVINDVLIRQQWPWSGSVSVDYVISGTEGVSYLIELSAYNGTGKICDIPNASFCSGDSVTSTDGQKHIVFDPTTVPALAGYGVIADFRLSLRAVPDTSEKLYKIIDLNKPRGEEGQFTYVTETALRRGVWGSFETNPYWISNSVMSRLGGATLFWTGITNDTDYSTDKLVLRRIKAGTYSVGSSRNTFNRLHNVVLTNDFWIGVYEVTQKQFVNIYGSDKAKFSSNGDSKPANGLKISHTLLRGCYTNELGEATAYDWPDGREVEPGSFMGVLREKTGMLFDLPTQARWEAAARGGSSDSGVYDGSTTPSNTTGYPIDKLGWHSKNSGGVFKKVGLLLPNAYGMYDVIGNVREMCLNWVGTEIPSDVTLTDPPGFSKTYTTNVPLRMLMGGTCTQSVDKGAVVHSAGSEAKVTPDICDKTDTGFRLSAPVVDGE